MPYRVTRCTPEQTRKSQVRPVATGSTARIEMAQSGNGPHSLRQDPASTAGIDPPTNHSRPTAQSGHNQELLLRLFSECPEFSGSSTGAASRSCHCKSAPWPSPDLQKRRSRGPEAARPHSQGLHAKCAGAARCDRAASPTPASVHSRIRSAGVGIRLRASSLPSSPLPPLGSFVRCANANALLVPQSGRNWASAEIAGSAPWH